ncbi:MAG: hypothetical protein FD165_2693 [Gammaproteobacteria bacterium]|nr:MAG: hypothetical protein FD165_2693 [Gammaproteobacteria bacterium]TND01756.1 MAG: hypothetical protein FD120_2520 [Gammaproteobacteria bacterium]
MKKSILLPLAVAFAAVVAAPAFAETKAVKDDPITHECKEAAKKDHVTANKINDYRSTYAA